jgi:hypothetical protein
MFEFVILCMIVLAVGYWATLWLMGRRNDVLHGDFVETEARPDVPSHPSLAAKPRAERLQALLTAIKQD